MQILLRYGQFFRAVAQRQSNVRVPTLLQWADKLGVAGDQSVWIVRIAAEPHSDPAVVEIQHQLARPELGTHEEILGGLYHHVQPARVDQRLAGDQRCNFIGRAATANAGLPVGCMDTHLREGFGAGQFEGKSPPLSRRKYGLHNPPLVLPDPLPEYVLERKIQGDRKHDPFAIIVNRLANRAACIQTLDG
jgi:hypothetical protein